MCLKPSNKQPDPEVSFKEGEKVNMSAVLNSSAWKDSSLEALFHKLVEQIGGCMSLKRRGSVLEAQAKQSTGMADVLDTSKALI